MTSDISSLVNLRVLNLGSNLHIKEIPGSISCLQKLEDLSLWDNPIQQLPMGITALSHLTRLCIMGRGEFKFPAHIQVHGETLSAHSHTRGLN
jgi:hypothetical protein